MKLYNAVVVWDIFVVAESSASARTTALNWIQGDEKPTPSEQVGLEAREDRNVRQAWRDEKPLVADDISDADFATLKGKTTIEAFKLIYTKSPEVKNAKDANPKTVSK